MKKIFKLLFICVSSCYFVACSSDNEIGVMGGDQEDAPSTELPKIIESATNGTRDYETFLKNIKSEYKDLIIYNDENRPDFSKEIEALGLENISQNNDSLSNNISTKNCPLGLAYGPYGNAHLGSYQSAPMYLAPCDRWKKITAVKVRYGWWIDGIQLFWTNDRGAQSASQHIGGYGGVEAYLPVSCNEYISDITVNYNNCYVVNIIIYKYNKFTNCKLGYMFGPQGCGLTGITVGGGYHQIQGVHATAGQYVHSLGAYFYPNSMFY